MTAERPRLDGDVHVRAGDVIGGKYELSNMLARGGMGAVWRARHLSLEIDVALKVMSPLLISSPEQRARFAREAKAAAQLKSPHVVQIHDYGVEGAAPYIVMELLAGEDLGARLRREKRLAPAAAADLATQIGRGLRKAHDMGIVHRDLKPANIFLSNGDEEEIVKLLDFGIARAGATGDSTLTGELLGSPPYMSPEQARGLKSLDARTDQWSLGVVLYRMLAGRLPFQSDQAGDLIVKICTEPAPLLSSVTPGLPRELDPFFAKVFEREPDRRFASVREMVDTFVRAAAPGVRSRPSTPNALPAAPAMPHVPVGRTTVRIDEALRKAKEAESVRKEAAAGALDAKDAGEQGAKDAAAQGAKDGGAQGAKDGGAPEGSTPITQPPPSLSTGPTVNLAPAGKAAAPSEKAISLRESTTLPLPARAPPPDAQQDAPPLAATVPDSPLAAPPLATTVPDKPRTSQPEIATLMDVATGGPTTRPIPAATQDGKRGRWLWIGALAVLVGGGAAAMLGLTRTASPNSAASAAGDDTPLPDSAAPQNTPIPAETPQGSTRADTPPADTGSPEIAPVSSGTAPLRAPESAAPAPSGGASARPPARAGAGVPPAAKTAVPAAPASATPKASAGPITAPSTTTPQKRVIWDTD